MAQETAPSAPADPESQTFLNIGDFKPPAASNTSPTTTLTDPVSSNPTGVDGHAHPTAAAFTVIFKVNYFINIPISIDQTN